LKKERIIQITSLASNNKNEIVFSLSREKMDEEKLRLTLGKLFDDKISSFRESFINDALASIKLSSKEPKEETIKDRLRSKEEVKSERHVNEMNKEELSPEEEKLESKVVEIKKKTEGKPEDQYYNIKSKRLLKNTISNQKTHNFQDVGGVRLCHKKDEGEEDFSSLCDFLRKKQGYNAQKEPEKEEQISVLDAENLTLPIVHYPPKSLDTNFNQESAEDYGREYKPIILDDRAEKSQLITYNNVDGPSFNDNDTKLEEGNILTSETIKEITQKDESTPSIKEKIQAEFREALSSVGASNSFLSKGYQAGPQSGFKDKRRNEPFSTTRDTRYNVNNNTYKSITRYEKPELTRNERMTYLLKRKK
jgi:hypothetical protein